MAVPSNYAALITAIDAILTTYGLSLFQVFGGRSTQPSLRELISLRWKLFSMTTPANYATLIAEIDVVIESYGLSLQEVFGGRSTQPTLQELIDLRYELFEVDGGGAADPSQIVSSTLPTTRVNPSTGLPSGGDPLQVGDRWYKPSVGQEGFWNGTLWLSTTVYTNVWAVLTQTVSGNGSAITTPVFGGADASIWFEKFVVNGTFASPQDGSNYRTFTVSVNTSSSTILATANSIGLTNRAKIIQPINVAAPTHSIGLSVGFVGSPGAITSFGMTVFYREIFS